MGGSVGGDLHTLRNLHKGMGDGATAAHHLKTSLDGHVNATVWTGKNADNFRKAWDEFKPHLDKLNHALTEGQTDVKHQHNNLAHATGEPDQI